MDRVRKLQKESRHLKIQMRRLGERADTLAVQVTENLRLAEHLQRSLLPKFTPEIPNISVTVKYLPAAGMGGDYYDVFEFGDKYRYGFLLADSQTHGLAATLLSVLLKVRLEEMKERFPDTHSFLRFLNEELIQANRGEKATLSLFYGILDRNSLQFEYTAAGPLLPLLVRNGKMTRIKTLANPPLGKEEQAAFRSNLITLKPADHFILHSDGLDRTFKGRVLEIFRSLVPALGADGSLGFQNEVLARIHAHNRHSPLADDITLIQISVHERALYLAGAEHLSEAALP
jgi:sigma-B regulation protein RsbU (phosphoserine phosphatase)